MIIQVNRKTIRKKRRGLAPVRYEIEDNVGTVRQLLEAMVRAEVAAYEKRQQDASSGICSWLGGEEIDDAAEEGKISFGALQREEPDRPGTVSREDAIRTMLEGFEDGLFRVLINGEEVRDADEEIHLTEESVVTIIRLTFLAGRLW